ncbi:hypothetical protein AVEN_226559-1 [Araneus ventricosus]|uniref:Uncharacterized protein n=1 Tax=Araneus ventricosus TaxID=182803 RepID=A0A4Y2UXJ5_ARAVE|nr:hypothetical protein AVEN_182979-1 [Araneus ventricosus]GBO17053.1 hypothetical protein AVEN_226559-1 [Araneus ventricosus]
MANEQPERYSLTSGPSDLTDAFPVVSRGQNLHCLTHDRDTRVTIDEWIIPCRYMESIGHVSESMNTPMLEKLGRLRFIFPIDFASIYFDQKTSLKSDLEKKWRRSF